MQQPSSQSYLSAYRFVVLATLLLVLALGYYWSYPGPLPVMTGFTVAGVCALAVTLGTYRPRVGRDDAPPPSWVRLVQLLCAVLSTIAVVITFKIMWALAQIILERGV